MIGFLVTLVSGVFIGTFSLGLTRTSKWSFGLSWFYGSMVALCLFSWPFGLLTVPGLLNIYGSVDNAVLIIAALLGIAWGFGGIFWGLGIDALGLALGVSLQMGLIAVVSSLGPMILLNPDKFLTPAGWMLCFGLLVMLVGIVFCALAGKAKDKEQQAAAGSSTSQESTRKSYPFSVGLVFCILSGFLSTSPNYAFNFCIDLKTVSLSRGVPELFGNNAMWVIVFTANYIVNALYGFIQVLKGNGFSEIKKGKKSYIFWMLFMGTLWPGGIILYGVGADLLGEMGGYAAYPLMLTFSLLASNLSGWLTGEWRGTSVSTRSKMITGIIIFVLASLLIGGSNLL